MAQSTRRTKTHEQTVKERQSQEHTPEETPDDATLIGPQPDPTSGGSDSAETGDSDQDPTAGTDNPAATGTDAGTAENTVTTAHVRTWAQAHPTLGQNLPNHGRLPGEVTAAYLAEFPGHTIVPVSGKKKIGSKPLIPIPVDAFDFESVPETEWETHPLTPAPVVREAFQVRFDNRVKAVYDEWVAAGKPEIRKSPRDRIAIAPQYGPAVRKALQSAGTFNKVHVVIQPVSHDAQGRQIIVFTATDKPPAKKPEAKPEPSDAEKAAMDTAKTEQDAVA